MAPKIKKRKLRDSMYPPDIITCLFSKDLDLILQTIFLLLDPVSLKHSRLVCRQWGYFIKHRVWGCEAGSKPNFCLRNRLAYHWRHAKPTVRSLEVDMNVYVTINSVSCDNSVVVCGMRNSTAKVYDIQNLELLAELNCMPRPSKELRRLQQWGQPHILEGSVESDVGQDIVATVTDTGVVSVWKKTDWSNLYKENPHGNKFVFDIQVFSNKIITFTDDGVLTILSWDGNRVSKVRMLNTLGEEPLTEIRSFDTDGEWLVVGMDTKLNVWRLSDNAFVHSIDKPFTKSVDVALSYPYVVISKASGENGMSVWDLRTGQQVRQFGLNEDCWIKLYGSILMGGLLDENFIKVTLSLFSLKQITRPELKEPVWSRMIHLPGPGGLNVCINTSCLMAVNGNKLRVFDFWNSNEFSDFSWDEFDSDNDINDEDEDDLNSDDD